MVGETDKYNAGGVPGGPPPIGDDLYGNGTAAKGRGRIQRYQVVGNDLEGIFFHHELLTQILHHAT